VAVSEIIVDRLSKLELHYPKLTHEQQDGLKVTREQLLAEG
jgi:hypothetical protein